VPLGSGSKEAGGTHAHAVLAPPLPPLRDSSSTSTTTSITLACPTCRLRPWASSARVLALGPAGAGPVVGRQQHRAPACTYPSRQVGRQSSSTHTQQAHAHPRAQARQARTACRFHRAMGAAAPQGVGAQARIAQAHCTGCVQQRSMAVQQASTCRTLPHRQTRKAAPRGPPVPACPKGYMLLLCSMIGPTRLR